MRQLRSGRVLRAALVGTIFTAGFLCGSLTQRNANAQLGELGKAGLQKAADSGGSLGSAVKLGEAITDMQLHVDGYRRTSTR